MWSYPKEEDGFSHSPSLSLDSTSSSETSLPVRVHQQVHRQGRERKTSIYVGGLHAGIEREDLRKNFKVFGTIKKIWVAHKPPGFAFIDFSDDQEAKVAIKEMNGARINGCKIYVALAHDKNQMSTYGQFRAGGGGGGGSCSYGDRAGHDNCGGNSRRKLRGGSSGGGGGGGFRSRSPIDTAFH